MALNLIGFAVARSEAQKQGLDAAEASRIGIVGAILDQPVMSLVAARALASKRAAEGAPVISTLPTGETPDPTEGECPSTPAEVSDPPTRGDLEKTQRLAREAKVAAEGAREAAHAAREEAAEAHRGVERIEAFLTEASGASWGQEAEATKRSRSTGKKAGSS